MLKKLKNLLKKPFNYKSLIDQDYFRRVEIKCEPNVFKIKDLKTDNTILYIEKQDDGSWLGMINHSYVEVVEE